MQYSKEKFAKIIYDLNNKILTYVNKNDSDLIYNYNLFINEYLIWTIYIIQYLSTINYDSKQYSIIRNILNLFISTSDINNWIDHCKSKLSYWLPISYKDSKGIENFFIDIVGTKDYDYKIPKDSIIISKFKNIDNLNEKLLCFTLNNTNDSILENKSTDVVINFIEKYIKSTQTLDIDQFEIIKTILDKCSFKDIHHLMHKKFDLIKHYDKHKREINKINKEISTIESLKMNCKNLISYEDVIKEIIKIKYKIPINNNSVDSFSSLNQKINKYQKELQNLVPN